MHAEIMNFKKQAENYGQKKEFVLAKEYYVQAITHENFSNEEEEIKIKIFCAFAKNSMKIVNNLKRKDIDKRLNELDEALGIMDFSKGLLKNEEISAIALIKAEIWKNKAWIFIDDKNDLETALNCYLNADSYLNKKFELDESNQLYQELRDIYRCIMNAKGDAAIEKEDFSGAIQFYSEAAQILQRFVQISQSKNKGLVQDRHMNDEHILADTYFNLGVSYFKIKDLATSILNFSLAQSMYKELQKKDNDAGRLELYEISLGEMNDYLVQFDEKAREIVPLVEVNSQPSKLISKPTLETSPSVSKDNRTLNKYITTSVESFAKSNHLYLKSHDKVSNNLTLKIYTPKDYTFTKLEKMIKKALIHVNPQKIGINAEEGFVAIKGSAIRTLYTNMNKPSFFKAPLNKEKQSNENTKSQIPQKSQESPKESKEQSKEIVTDTEVSLPKQNSASPSLKRPLNPESENTGKKFKTEAELKNMNIEQLQMFFDKLKEIEAEKLLAIRSAKEQLSEQIKASQEMLAQLENRQFNL